ncbi:carbohydrate kinase [Flavobacterium franklandianum]|uniref:gluconokinase n=1 Tax=Flavobacterium franklandianum TaxID=2594430 RepID=UPI001179A739|nr:gluconokinase [Flavobacterium franklandianum]TRX24832.1 carbohydrate kinase [Flavobacterium franklandianum]
MEQSYIGIDIGTTATKAVCFDKMGNIIRQFSKEYSIYHPEFNWSIQKPAEILTAVLECIQEITKDSTPEFISFSSAMQSIMVIDETGIPISDAMLWADNRAHLESEELQNSNQGTLFYQKTGIPIHPFSPMAKIDWLRKNDAEIFSRAFKFISIKEYVWHQLTGEYVIDSSMASGTGILNIHSLDWDTAILKYLQIHPSKLSDIVSPMHQSKGISDDFRYIIGGGDGPLANLGSGAMEKGKMALSIGTSGAVRIPVDEPFIDSQMRTQCYHLMENQYLKLGAVNNGAIVLQWLKESILKTDESFEDLFDLAEKIPAGSEGLLFVPYLLGERAPIWNASAQGTLLGISINHSKAHLIRATLEGILFGLFSVVEILIPDLQKRQETTVMASGGFGKSELWLQMAADIFQMKLAVSSTIESGTWGAVLIGFKAIGIEIPVTNTTEKNFLPNPNHKLVYQQSFEKFKRVYPLLRSL